MAGQSSPSPYVATADTSSGMPGFIQYLALNLQKNKVSVIFIKQVVYTQPALIVFAYFIRFYL
jgi:hypothetical protein